MTSSIETMSRRVKTKIGTLSGRVPNKDIRHRLWRKFVGCIWAKPRIAKASKAMKFSVVRKSTKEFKEWETICKVGVERRLMR